ncbi:MAG TPA: glycosyl hydrolase, partial [Clostridiales bacterium]|nr:glycosyl hydrolase [Clostridiales bacterium]
MEELPAFTNYSMKGRTYRYMETEPLYPFGFGLTYSRVELRDLRIQNKIAKESDIRLSVEIKNAGSYDTDEVVQFYIKDRNSKYAVPNPCLCGFQRIHLGRGESRVVEAMIPNKA